MTNNRFGDNGIREGCGAIMVLAGLFISIMAFCTGILDHFFKFLGF